MPDPKNTWSANRKYLFQLLFFISSIIIVVSILPRQGKFRYEFEKGRPWLHDALIAPWDFPVYKSDFDITHERDSVLKSFAPFYNYDSLITDYEISEFNRYLEELKLTFKSDSTSLTETEFNIASKELNAILKNVYDSGIIQTADINEIINPGESRIIIVKGNVGEEKDLNNVYAQKDAFQVVNAKKDELENRFISISNIKLSRFADIVSFYDFVKPNLKYDEIKSTAYLDQLMNNISLAKGLVQEGELIITRGEIVNDSKFTILESLKNESEKRLGQYNSWFILLGKIILVSACYLVLYLFLYHFRREVLDKFLKTFFIILIILLFVGITRLVIDMPRVSVFIIPFAMIPIVVRTFYDSRLALFIHLVTIMLVGFLVPNSFEFVFISFIIGVVVIISLTNVYRRAKLLFSAIVVVSCYSVIYFGMSIMQEGSLRTIDWSVFSWFGGNGILLLLSYPMIFIFEKSFKFLSDATLFELSDTNQPLLRRLAQEAPGSFQHSLQVANLGEEAARAIGANDLLVRTGALYHDIGKLKGAEYFIENQREGFNPHEDLDPLDSASLVINHIKEGVELAKKFKLPPLLIDFIRTHQGTTRAYYFYKKFVDKNPDESDNPGFSYPGPKPFSKETAILMIADAVEAASRSIKNFSEESITELVERIIDVQVQEGQFTEAPITFKDITVIKKVLVKRLINIFHVRVAYPERK
jgi:putative nucleotidyltransferase with HDIG domain